MEPVSLTEAKAHLRTDGTDEDTFDEDTFIEGLIPVAREYCEDFQQRAYITQTWELWLDKWPDKDYIIIPRPPLQVVTSVKYYGTDNIEYTFAATEYFVDDKNEPGRVVLAYAKSWPLTTLRPVNGVAVQFTAGYPAKEGNPPDPAGNIPKKIKQAMLLLIGYWYENREAAVIGAVSREIEFAVHALLWQDRVLMF